MPGKVAKKRFEAGAGQSVNSAARSDLMRQAARRGSIEEIARAAFIAPAGR
jgi:hypothetical protein